MAKRLRINNPDLTRAEKSYLTSAYSSGTTLNVVNSFAYAADNFAIVGEPGKDESIESERISAIPAGGLTLTLISALDYDYPKDTVIYQSRYDQIEIESRASSSASFANITTSGIQWDKRQTLYVDANGIATTQYRWRFKNSSTLTTSDYSPTLTGAGFGDNTVGYLIRETRLLTGDLDGRIARDVEIVRFADRAQQIIYAHRQDWWFLRVYNDSSITTAAATATYNLDLLGGGSAGSPGTKLGFIDLVRYRLSDGSQNVTYALEYKPQVELDYLTRDNNATDDDNVVNYTLLPPDSNSKNGYIKLYPRPKSAVGTLFIDFYKKPDILNSGDDVVAVPLPSILLDYCIGQIEKIRGNDTKSAYYEELFWGPADKLEGSKRLSGIALLEQLNSAQIRPRGQPRSLINFRGVRAMSKLFGNRVVSPDSLKDYF